MTSKERIKRIFSHKMPDRIGIFDFFDEITLTNWKEQGLLPEIEPVEYFDFDLDFRTEKPAKNKFFIFSFNGPFQRLVSKKGLSQSLIDFAREPRHTKDFFKDSLKNIFSEYKVLKEKSLPAGRQGHKLNGIWLCEDIAYDNGLYFSLEKYKSLLLDFHKEINSFFQNEGLSVVFHCDGNTEQILPLLAKANFSGIHPLQESCNHNLLRIKKDFKGAITFIGGIGLSHLRGLHQDILDRMEELKQDGDYIFCFDGPVPAETEFKTYDDLLKRIEAAGAYK